MADNIKPYNPNKSWIEFKLNPDAIIDELGNLIPYRHTIGMIDSEAPWSEVGKSALRETPILGSILAGEPLDAAKEAILFGAPIKAPAKSKARINKLPKDTKFMFGVDNQYNNNIAHSPSTNQTWKLESIDGELYPVPSKLLDKSQIDYMLNNNQSYKAAQVNEFIDNTNALHKLNKKDKLNFNADEYNKSNPYEFDRLDDPNFTSTIDGQMLQEGNALSEIYSGGGRDAYKNLEHRIRNQNVAKLVTPHLKNTESLYIDKFNNLYIKDKQGKYWYFQNDPHSGRIIDKYIDKPDNPVPYSDPNLNADLTAWKAKVKAYNAKYGFEDNFINYKDSRQWQNDVYDARDAYLNSIYGPFYEDIMGYDR